MSDVKYNQDKLEKDSQSFMDTYRSRMKDVADEILGELYVNVMPYLETDTWSNYRQALRTELEHEYKFSKFKCDWATNFRRAVFVENREEISKYIESDILKIIKQLEDNHQEYEGFRYTPMGDTYQCLKKENGKLEAINKQINEQLMNFDVSKEKLEAELKKNEAIRGMLAGVLSDYLDRDIIDIYIKEIERGEG